MNTVHVPKRENAIVNRLNKTKAEREVDHEQERVDRLKKEQQVKRVEAAARVRAIPQYSFLTPYLFPPYFSERKRKSLRSSEQQTKQLGIIRYWIKGTTKTRVRRARSRRRCRR